MAYIEDTLADVQARLASVEAKLNRVLGMLLGDANRDIEMARGQEKLSAEIEELNQKVDEYTSQAAKRIEDAVAEARAAWDAGTDAEFEAAATRLDEIAKKLSTENPADPDVGPFEPSQQ